MSATKYRIEDVHWWIVNDACDIANKDPWVTETFGGFVFHPGHDQRYSFVITWDEGISHTPPEIIEQLHRIGKKALRQSLKKNEDMLAGLIVGLARQNKNYFELFDR